VVNNFGQETLKGKHAPNICEYLLYQVSTGVLSGNHGPVKTEFTYPEDWTMFMPTFACQISSMWCWAHCSER